MLKPSIFFILFYLFYSYLQHLVGIHFEPIELELSSTGINQI